MAPGRAERPALRWADLRLRVISALVLAPLTIGIVWLGGVIWALLVLVAATVLVFEWLGMCWAPARTGAPAGPVYPIATAGLLYIGLAAVAMIWLRREVSGGVSGRANVLFLAFVIWASDVGAYLAGRLLGGPRLAPRISPGKTWAGAAGGLLTAVLVGYGITVWMSHPDQAEPAFGRVALIAALLAIAAQLGDLLESALKRRFGVKDAGRLIPGHGGLLDRLDGFLAAAPVAALLALALGSGKVLWR